MRRSRRALVPFVAMAVAWALVGCGDTPADDDGDDDMVVIDASPADAPVPLPDAAPDAMPLPDGGGEPICPNGTCEEGETCLSCPADCTAGCGAVCGDFFCDVAAGECAFCPG